MNARVPEQESESTRGGGRGSERIPSQEKVLGVGRRTEDGVSMEESQIIRQYLAQTSKEGREG